MSPAGEDPTAPVVSLGSLEVGQLPALAWEGLCQVHAELSVRLRLPRQAWVSGKRHTYSLVQMVLGVEGSRSMGVMVYVCLQGHGATCIWGIAESCVQL